MIWSHRSASFWCRELREGFSRFFLATTSSWFRFAQSSELCSSGQSNCQFRTSNQILCSSNHFLFNIRSCWPRSTMTIEMFCCHRPSIHRCRMMTCVACPGLLLYSESRIEVFNLIIFVSKNLAALIASEVLINERPFASESASAEVEISYLFFTIWHGILKDFPPTSWLRLIGEQSTS